MHRVIVATLACTVVLTACGSDGDQGAATDAGSTRSSTSTSSSSTTSTTAPCEVVGTVQPKENPLASVDQLLTEVATATDACIDTITFTFRPSAAPAPSYRIEYADGPFRDTAGREVKPEGAAFLRIRFQPAWIADLTMESAPLTYTGPREITPAGMNVVRGLALYDATEAMVGWVVGLDAQHPFSVEGAAGKVVVTLG